MPTFYESEAFPVVLLEAMAYGLPIVATRWRGIPSIVDHDQTGFLVRAATAPVAERLENIGRGPHAPRADGAGGARKFLREFEWATHVANMRQVFLDTAGVVAASKSTAKVEPAHEMESEVEALT